MNDELNQSTINYNKVPPKKNNKILVILVIIMGLLLVLCIGYYLGTIGIFNNDNNIKDIENDNQINKEEDNDSAGNYNQIGNEEETEMEKICREQKGFLEKILALESVNPVLRYSLIDEPLPSSIVESVLYKNVGNSDFDANLRLSGKSCIIATNLMLYDDRGFYPHDYVYDIEKNKMYYVGDLEIIYEDELDYYSALLFSTAYNVICHPKHDVETTLCPTKYDGSDIYVVNEVEADDCPNGQIQVLPGYTTYNPQKSYNEIIINLNNKTCTIKNY